jgi:hypothetical protein
MEHSIKFVLPEDKESLEVFLKAQEMYELLTDIRETIRKKLKYGPLEEETYSHLEMIQRELYRLELP